MARVKLTRHLFTFFKSPEGRDLNLPGRTVAEVIQEVEKLAHGFAFYACDESGRLCQHVNVFIDSRLIRDRSTLTDPVPDGSRVLILQALSGGGHLRRPVRSHPRRHPQGHLPDRQIRLPLAAAARRPLRPRRPLRRARPARQHPVGRARPLPPGGQTLALHRRRPPLGRRAERGPGLPVGGAARSGIAVGAESPSSRAIPGALLA